MHKIFELKEMDDEKLLSIAEELGIKGAKKKDKEALVYEIMDKEAVIDSQKEPEKPARKRGRPKKNTPADQSGKPAAKASKEEKAQPAETGKPDTDTETAAEAASGNADEKKDGTQSTKTLKKRGRKPKNQQTQGQQPQQADPAEEKTEEPAVQEAAAETEPEDSQEQRIRRARIKAQEILQKAAEKANGQQREAAQGQNPDLKKGEAAQQDGMQQQGKLPLQKDRRNAQFGNGTQDKQQFQPYYLPEKWVIDLYEPSDIRFQTYFLDTTVAVAAGEKVPDIYVLYKFSGNPALRSGTSWNYQIQPKVFRIAEMYLIAAEASAMGAGADPMEYVNRLRTNRGASSVTPSADKTVMDIIMEERVREFIGEGFRIQDLKRMKYNLERGEAQNPSTLYQPDIHQSFFKSYADPKMLYPIPQAELDANPNMAGEQNDQY